MIKELAVLGTYQLSTVGPGAVATGLENIRQCIDLILRTIKGSDPLRPEFGCDVFRFSDRPYNIAIPNMKKAIVDALNLWETRITVSSITHEIVLQNLIFNITYVTSQGIEETIRFALNNEGSTSVGQPGGGIIISAFIPSPITNGRYFINLLLDGIGAIPAVPASGFSNTGDMLAWVNSNYANYGRWYVADGKLVLYLASGVNQSVTLTVTQTALLTLKAQIFDLEPGEFYSLSLTLNGVNATPAFPTNSINNIEALLNWLRVNWAYGTWALESVSSTGTSGDFNEDFNEDFDNTGGIAGSRFLVFQTQNYTTGTLIFN